MNEKELKMFEENKKLVPYCLKYFKYSKQEYEPLLQEGYMGLIYAIKNYNEEKGKFSTFAISYIKGYMNNYFAFQGEGFSVKLSSHDSRKFYKIQRYKNKYFALNGHYPTDENISKELKISLKTVKLINQTVNTIFLDKSVSLNNSKQEKFKDNTYDIIGSNEKNDYNDFILKDSLKSAINNLSDELKYIVTEYYFKNRTQKEIGKELGHDQIYISRKLKTAIKILRSEMEIVA